MKKLIHFLILGFSLVDNHMKFGRRHDAYKGNLEDIIKSRKNNLVIRKFSLVTKINFETINNTLRAIGVTYERHGRIFEVTAKREVILSAGTLGTAKLLMLSGIGPKDDLEKIGVLITFMILILSLVNCLTD